MFKINYEADTKLELIQSWLSDYASNKYGYDEGDEIQIISLIKDFLDSDESRLTHIRDFDNQTTEFKNIYRRIADLK